MEIPLSFIGMELLGTSIFLLCFFHARRLGKDYLFELGIAAVYGILLEALSIIQLDAYQYGTFFVMIGGVPIAVGLGWAAIIYTSLRLTERLAIKDSLKPFLAALLALNIDLSMDTIAIRAGFWKWSTVGEWFGVPLLNFFAWYVIAFSFVGFLIYFRNRKNRYAPLIAFVLSIIVLLVLDGMWMFWLPSVAYPYVLGSMIVVSMFLVFRNFKKFKMDNKFELILFLPQTMIHIFFVSILVLNDFYGLPILGWVAGSMLVLGLLVHALPSLNHITRKKNKAN